MQDSTILYFNAFLWVATLIYWWRKKSDNVGVVVLALYTAIACVSCHLYKNPLFIVFFGDISISLFPFIYLFVTIVLLIRPLFYIEYNKISEIKLPPLNIMNLICAYIVVCAIYQLIVSMPEVKAGIDGMLSDSSNSIDAYLETTDENLNKKSLSGSLNFLGFFVSMGVGFSMFFFFVYLLYPNKNKWLMAGMIIAVMTQPIISLASGSREKVVTTIIVFLFMYVLLRPLLSKKIRKVISYGTVVMAALLFILFFIISYARASGNFENLMSGLESYFGMSFLIFDDKCLFANGTREGNVVSPLINVLFGGRTYSQVEIRDMYASLGVDNGVFYTFVGDFVLDYGPLLAFIILMAIAFFFNKKLRVKDSLTGGHLVLYYVLLKLLSGFYLHQYTGVGGNITIILFVFLYLFLSDKRFLISIKRTV